jgi:cytochrome c oxidase accessory protein FixG
VAGRLWCGYTCPQTVYTEIFMWAERKIEGDRIARMRLDQAPWGANKICARAPSRLVWLAIACHRLQLRRLLHADPGAGRRRAWAWTCRPWNAFWVLFYGAATYGNAGFLREQVCKYMCPYARFQSAMIDKDSLVIAYDAGTRRPARLALEEGRRRRAGLGDCIDCTLCVQVCPTGIDIRNGLQNECIGCAACIDVCDDVMDKMGYAAGLIRYATENGRCRCMCTFRSASRCATTAPATRSSPSTTSARALPALSQPRGRPAAWRASGPGQARR